MMLSVFSNMLAKESDLRVIDNLCAALCRMILSNVDAVPLEQVWSLPADADVFFFFFLTNLDWYRIFIMITHCLWNCFPSGAASAGGSSSPQRGHGGEQNSVWLPDHALLPEPWSGITQRYSAHTHTHSCGKLIETFKVIILSPFFLLCFRW